jgi:hypothetical protein
VVCEPVQLFFFWYSSSSCLRAACCARLLRAIVRSSVVRVFALVAERSSVVRVFDLIEGRMYNPITDTVILSRDVKWTNWERSDPTAALKELQDLTVPVKNVVPPIEQPPLDDMNPGAHVIPDDEFDDVFEPNVGRNDDIPQDQDVIQPVIEIGRNDANNQDRNTAPTEADPASTRMGTRNTPSRENDHNTVGQQRNIEVQRLHTYYNPTAALIDEDEQELQQGMAHPLMHTLQSDPGEPKNLEEAFNGPDKAKWYSSVRDEVQNFLDRDAWKEVPLHKVVKEGRKPFRTKTLQVLDRISGSPMK